MKSHFVKKNKGPAHVAALKLKGCKTFEEIEKVLTAETARWEAIKHVLDFYVSQCEGVEQTTYWQESIDKQPTQDPSVTPATSIKNTKDAMKKLVPGLFTEEFCPACRCTSHTLKNCPGKKKLDDFFKNSKGFRV